MSVRKLKRTFKSLAIAAIIGAAPIVLSACQSVESGAMITDASFWQHMQTKLKNIKDISLSGRVKFSSPAQKFSATFQYSGQDSSNYTLRLSSTLGNELALLKVTPSSAMLTAAGRTISSPDAETLFASATELNLPLKEFHSLLIGIAPNEYSQFTPEGILMQSQVPGFIINYRNYMTVDKVALPSEIEVIGNNLHMMITPRNVQKIEYH